MQNYFWCVFVVQSVPSFSSIIEVEKWKSGWFFPLVQTSFLLQQQFVVYKMPVLVFSRATNHIFWNSFKKLFGKWKKQTVSTKKVVRMFLCFFSPENLYLLSFCKLDVILSFRCDYCKSLNQTKIFCLFCAFCISAPKVDGLFLR